MNLNLTRRHTFKALAASTLAFALSTGVSFAEGNADIKIGFTPKFLKDDFQTLMLDLSKKAFEAEGFVDDERVGGLRYRHNPYCRYRSGRQRAALCIQDPR